MGKYDDIIHLPHLTSERHPRMKMIDRAAQFSPFAALTGYDSAIEETARLTGSRITLDEDTKYDLDLKQQMLSDCISNHPEISVTYFVPDERKEGGEYVTVSGRVKKIDTYQRQIVFLDGKTTPLSEIIDMKGDLFQAIL